MPFLKRRLSKTNSLGKCLTSLSLYRHQEGARSMDSAMQKCGSGIFIEGPLRYLWNVLLSIKRRPEFGQENVIAVVSYNGVAHFFLDCSMVLVKVTTSARVDYVFISQEQCV